MRIKILTSFIIVLIASMGYAQVELKGRIGNGQNENLQGAHIQLVGPQQKITTSDKQGNFAFKNLLKGRYTLSASFVGYTTFIDTLTIDNSLIKDVKLEKKTELEEAVIISATRAKTTTPATVQNISRVEIERLNTGKDLPFLLENTPSAVITSDAGTGVGYTGLWIRGTDMSRINIMINGIPLNDPESHLVYWVDLPDFASSTDNIQIQRGVGTSVNGASAFGASINLQTKHLSDEPFAGINTTAGSFNTLKNMVSFGTGLLNKRFAFEGRLSKISSDGYIDRASANLKSFYLSGGYYGNKTIARVNIFSGKEITYQAWEGVPSYMLETHRTFNPAGMYYGANGDTLYYNNQVDDYQQDHFQAFISHQANTGLLLNLALHYTKGYGFYESFKQADDFADYGLQNVINLSDTLFSTDLIRRKCMDNKYYGTTFSAIYEKKDKLWATIGGSINTYKGDHFGRIIWAQFASNSTPEYNYYFNQSEKRDASFYSKIIYHINKPLSLFVDLQYRTVHYTLQGKRDNLEELNQKHNFNFLNPKAGVTYYTSAKSKAYVSVAVANREPSRYNFQDADNAYLPRPERLTDFEVGYEIQNKNFKTMANAYYMLYKDQLVLTGKINNIGAAIMTNVPKSYRAGIELSASLNLGKYFEVAGNLTFSENKIKGFTEYIDNWDTWGQDSIYLGNTTISFSPSTIGSLNLVAKPTEKMHISLNNKYVGKQYIDNTTNEDKILPAYFTSNLRADYWFTIPKVKTISIFISLNNLFNNLYETNAWVYTYIYENQRQKMDGYFPQAGLNYSMGLTVKF